uniref:F-box domain-containing protein n=1 Tax=Ananas comosus var. bracteatus TaxID=296719 RepID=A0A6V7PTR7_ANACO|nr:unnamed protein product [Ananas comosus var. bracteatus]
MIALMDDELSWESLSTDHFASDMVDFRTVPERNDGEEQFMVSLDSILPDDLLEKILSFLPVASILRATSVCRRWRDIVRSRRFLWANKSPQKPWYFMFTCNEAAAGYAYDPSSENGITSVSLALRKAIGLSLRLVVAKSKQIPGDFLQWDFSIHMYDSKSRNWITSIEEVFMGWRGGDDSVICNGILYCLVHSTGILGSSNFRHSLIIYDLAARSSRTSLMHDSIPAPCSLTCGRLMNLKERLVMVGGIAKNERPDIIRGIGIWELYDNKEWREVARMPHKFFQGFGEFDDVFASSGTDGLIYIQSYGATALLVFDMSQKQWRWSVKCPVTKRFPLQLFTGFTFEPRLEVGP